MAVIATRYWQLGSLVLATNSHIAEEMPLSLPERRLEFHRAAYLDGGTDSADLAVFYEPRTIQIPVVITPYDADGNVSHAGGIYNEHRKNLDDLAKEITKPGRIDLRAVIANPDAAGTLTLQGYARQVAATNWRGGPLVKRADLNLVMAYPFFHIGTVATTVALPAATSTPIALGGVAPVADMVIFYTAAGTVTFDEGADEWIQITQMPTFGAVRVDIGGRTVQTCEVYDVDRGAATAGTFTLTVLGATTTAIAYNASAATVAAALEALSTVTDVSVTGTGTTGDPWRIEFRDPHNLTADMTGNGAGLTGGSLTVTKRQDGGADWRPYIRLGQPWGMRWPAASTVTLTTSGGAAGSVDYLEATW